MFESKILTTNDQKEWHEILHRHNFADVNYLPEYLTIFEKETNMAPFTSFGGKGQLFVFGDSNNQIIYPFFKRNISDLSFSDDNTKNMFDIISPYGYGGPIALADLESNEELWKNYFSSFDSYCKSENIVSEFCRLQPYFRNQGPVSKYSNGTVIKSGQVVYIDLTLSEDALLAEMIKGHRRKICKALNSSDIQFNTDVSPESPNIFFNIYSENMQRVGASEKYFFSQTFFNSVFKYLENTICFGRITYQGNDCSVLITLAAGEVAYAWLSGTKADYMSINPNNIIMYQSMIRLKKEGFKVLIMGGGRGNLADSLYSFKAGFSPLNLDFYIYKKIHLQAEYNKLVELRNLKAPIEQFFPLYRLE